MRVPSLDRKIPWRRAWQPTPVFLPGESHRQRSLVGYSPQGCKESDMTKVTQYVQMPLSYLFWNHHRIYPFYRLFDLFSKHSPEDLACIQPFESPLKHDFLQKFSLSSPK